MQFIKGTKFIAVVILQVIIILVIILFKVAIVTGGTEVLLKMAPVDPRDPFRGDFVTFQYDISRLDSGLFTYSPIKNGDEVYIPLAKQGKYWVARYGVSRSFPSSQGFSGNTVYIKGRVRSAAEEVEPFRGEPPRPRPITIRTVEILYGTEEYFIPEGTGRGVSFFNREVGAKIAIDDEGNAVLKQIFLDDEPWP